MIQGVGLKVKAVSISSPQCVRRYLWALLEGASNKPSYDPTRPPRPLSSTLERWPKGILVAKISVVVVDDDKSLRNALVSGIREDKDQGWRLAGTASAGPGATDKGH